MPHPATHSLVGFALAFTIAASTAWAQQPPTVRVRGTIEKMDGQNMTVKTRDGTNLTIKLADNVNVIAIAKRTIADIKAGDYVGVTGVAEGGEGQKALEIHIFPESMRGTGEGHRPWDLVPQSTMTNAAVTENVVKAGGHSLTLKYKDGEQTFLVTSATAIVGYVPGEKSELKPGARIFIPAATKKEDGNLETARVNVGREAPPPM